MNEIMMNVCLIGCGFFAGIMVMDIISAHLGSFNVAMIRKMDEQIYDIKRLIRKTNKKIKRYVKSDSCPIQYYSVDCTTIPTGCVDKFQSYYIKRGFKVWTDNINTIYISWEEDDVSSSDNN